MYVYIYICIIYRQAGRQAGRQADRQAGRQADRQTDIYLCIYILYMYICIQSRKIASCFIRIDNEG